MAGHQKLGFTLIAIVIAWFVAGYAMPYFGLSMNTTGWIVYYAGLFAFLGGLAIVAKAPFISDSARTTTWVTIIAVVILVAVYFLGVNFNGFTVPATGASIVSTTVVPVQTNTGDSATVTVYARDRENNNPNTKSNSAELRIYVNGAERALTGNSNAGTFTGSIGQSYRIVGGNATQYVDEVTGNIPTATASVDIPAHTAVAQTDLAITCYNSAGTVLDSPANSSVADYNITVGASQQVLFSCKIVDNVADKAFNLGAISTMAYNNTDSLVLESFHSKVCGSGHTSCQGADSVGFTSVVVPKFLRNINMGPVGYFDSGMNITTASFTNAYQFSKPVLLQEFDEARYSFTIKGATTDPTMNVESSFKGANLGIICFHDSIWTQGADGQEYMSWYSVDNSQDNKGIKEYPNDPIGKNSCVVLTEI